MKKINFQNLLDFKDFGFKKKIYYNVGHQKFFLKKKKYCEICGSNKIIDLTNIGKINFSNNKYDYLSVKICNNCSFKFLNPRPNDDFYIKYFQLDYTKNFFKKKNNVDKKKVNLQIKNSKLLFNFLSKKIKLQKGKILDHGCSTGSKSLIWKKKKWDVYGIDPNIVSINYGINKFDLNLETAFGEKLPYKKSFFDLIISLGSLEHCFDLNKNLKELNRVTKEGGYIFIRFRPDKFYGSILEYYNSVTLRYFNDQNLKYILNKNNFKIIFFTNKPLENYNTFRYVLAIKKPKVKLIKKFKKVKQVIKYHGDYFLKYYNMSLKLNLKGLSKVNAKLSDKIKFIKKNKIKIMDLGSTKNSINRFFVETTKFLNLLSIYKK